MVELGPRHEGDRVVVHLDPGQPIELGNLSESFAALARLYERHYRKEGESAPKLYVTKLETGSIWMEIAPYLPLLGQVVAIADSALIMADFTDRIWKGIKAFSADPGDAPRQNPPPIDDARDIREFVKPLLGKRGALLGITHARYEKTDGERKTVVEYDFDEAELNRAALNIDEAIGTNLLPVDDHNKTEKKCVEVMLFIDQANRGPGKEKGRTGDKGVIPEISEKPLPVYFKKGLNDLKGHITKDVNPLTSTFIVDVYVHYVGEEPRGYTVTHVHQSIDDDR